MAARCFSPWDKIAGPSFELIADTHLFGQHPGTLSDSGIELQGPGYAVGVQDVIIDVEIVEKFKILKYKTDMGDAKLSPLSIIELIHGSIINADAAPASA